MSCNYLWQIQGGNGAIALSLTLMSYVGAHYTCALIPPVCVLMVGCILPILTLFISVPRLALTTSRCPDILYLPSDMRVGCEFQVLKGKGEKGRQCLFLDFTLDLPLVTTEYKIFLAHPFFHSGLPNNPLPL